MIYVNPGRFIGVLGLVLLLKCNCIARVMIVTDAIYCDDCKLFIVLAKADITPTTDQLPSADVAVPPGL
jgi:hypothetical protein